MARYDCACVLVVVLALSLPSSAQLRHIKGRYVTVSIGATDCTVTDPPFSAKGDGVTNATASIQRALDSCGRVIIPPGRFLISSLNIKKSNTELHVSAGATLLVSNDIAKFPVGGHIIGVKNVHDVAITGPGTVDGQGLVWWREMGKPGRHDMWRPHTVDMSHVTNGILTDTRYINGPNHVLELGCDHCEVGHVTVLNPPSTGDCKNDDSCSHNTDAVDVHGDPFWVHNVNFTTGDDNIAGHANNTLVEDSYMGSGHGASIGSLCNSWLHNITFRNITFHGTTAGARIKAHPACAGHVWDVTYEDLVMDRVDNVINLGMFYFAPTPIRLNTSTMRYTDILFKNIRATQSGDKGHGGNAVAFNCDTTIKAGNCVVDIDGLSLTDMGAGVESQMECQGAFGTVKDVVGLKNCLKAPPGGTCSSPGVKCGNSDPLAPKCCGNATCSLLPDCGGPPSPPPPSLCFLAPPPPPPGCKAIGGKCAALTDCCPDNWCHEIVCQSGTCTRQFPPTPPSSVSSEQQKP